MKTLAPAKRPKTTFNLGAAMKTLVANSTEATDDRFSVARRVVDALPSALSTPAAEPLQIAATTSPGDPLDVSSFQVGQSYEVPIGLIDSNPIGARVFYRVENIDQMSESMFQQNQLVSVNGFVKGNRIELYDGETRLRSARARGIPRLLVKVDTPPVDALDQYTRSAHLNNQRSNHNALDIAVRLKQFLDIGIYPNQEALMQNYRDEKGRQLSKSQVSMYMRIGRIPERFLQKMSQADSTSSFTVAYEVGAIFDTPEYAAQPDKFDALAHDVIETIQSKELSKEQSKNLILSKLQDKQSRMRAESIPVKYGATKGTLKIFPLRGQLDLSFKGLTDDKLPELRELVEKMLAGQMAL